MERNEILERTGKIIRHVLKDETIQLNGELTAGDINGWDSLSHMIIIVELEKEFNIKFRLRELNQLSDVNALLSLIESKV